MNGRFRQFLILLPMLAGCDWRHETQFMIEYAAPVAPEQVQGVQGVLGEVARTHGLAQKESPNRSYFPRNVFVESHPENPNLPIGFSIVYEGRDYIVIEMSEFDRGSP